MEVAEQGLPPAADPVLLEELIVEILSWVPVRSLMRFRCVSKAWNLLMFDPTLVKLHLRRSSKNAHVLLMCGDGDIFKDWVSTCAIRGLFENPSSTLDDDCHIIEHNDIFVGSCNGLVCFIRQEFKELSVRFWNPATRFMSEDSPHIITLHFHRLGYKVQPAKYGFGYDKRSDTYKVVLFLLDAKTENWEVKVHSMGDTGWRGVLTFPAFPILGVVDGGGQFVNSTVNWLAIQNSDYDYEWDTVMVNQLVILSYDLNKETYKYFSMPDGLFEVPDLEPDLAVLNGCLCLSHGYRRTHFVVWLMMEFGVEKSWTKLLNITYEQLHVHPFYENEVKPLCFSENDDVLLLADSLNKTCIFYNWRDNRIERTEDFNDHVPLSSHEYVHSLVLPYRK